MYPSKPNKTVIGLFGAGISPGVNCTNVPVENFVVIVSPDDIPTDNGVLIVMLFVVTDKIVPVFVSTVIELPVSKSAVELRYSVVAPVEVDIAICVDVLNKLPDVLECNT